MAGVPAFNIIASLLYISLAGATMFLLKLAAKPILIPTNKQQKAKQPQESSKIYRRMIVSWFKKYSIIGSITLSDRKYLAKQLLITSVYGVACLKINKITLWPVALITFLLPIIFFLYQMVLKLQRNHKNETQSKNKNQVQIEIQGEMVEGIRVAQNNQVHNSQKQNKQFRNLFQIILISIFAFIAVVLDLQTVMVLDKSISNSGELNLISVFCIVLLDQFLLRPVSGLLFVAVIKLLEYKSLISLHENRLVIFLCQQLLREEQIEEDIKRAKALLENTQTHLKSNQMEIVRQTNVPIKPDRTSMVFLDLDHIKPPEKQIQSPHQALCQSKCLTDEEQVYLTTPEKQLFEVDFFGNNQETILSSIDNKQNAENINKSQSFYQQHEKQQINCFEELILTRDHEPLQNIQNLEPTFKTEQQLQEEKKRKIQNRKKNNRRVLKLTGNSPYLQYLPNMLKNVRKTAQTTAVTTGVTTAPKLAQLNFR